MDDYFQKSLELHAKLGGKWEIASKVRVHTQKDLSIVYTPGVAAVCEEIERDPASAYTLSMKGNSVAIVSNGSAVLGLGDIGPEASLPVMEGKAILFKKFAGIDGVPIVIQNKTAKEIIATVKSIAPTFGGINLEDIKAPICFEVEEGLQDIGIPVFHDDQQGTAIVLLAALINAAKVVGKKIEDLHVVINGAGAAGTAIAKLLKCVGYEGSRCTPVRTLYMCDSQGIISSKRKELSDVKRRLLKFTNSDHREGSVGEALKGADVFIGVSRANLLSSDHIHLMAKDAIVFALANPIPEISPKEALKGGAAVVGTGRSDLPNQINNVLVFPGIFRGALDARAPRITEEMKIAAAFALAASVEVIDKDHILPKPLDHSVVFKIAKAVAEAAKRG